jgi:hypothetical protein
MTFNLKDLRDAYYTYVRDHVKVSMSPIRPAVPITLNPNEEFSFDILIQNDPESAGGIPIGNVRVHVNLFQPPGPEQASAQFIVPEIRGIKEVLLHEGDPSSVLSPGQLVDKMCIFLTLAMKPGNQIKLPGLKGKAGDRLGFCVIDCDVFAVVDMDWLFPKDSHTSASTDVQVT